MLLAKRRKQFLLELVLFLSAGSSPLLGASQADEATYLAKRQKAETLFSNGRRLEALPLLEELAQANPKDDAMLVALAAALVDRAATQSDQTAAAKDRFRARDLLEKASALGNRSPLAQNLLQLLRGLPENGALKFSDNPEVERIMNEGEAAFARRDYDAALMSYGRVVQLDPKNYSAVLFTGNTYDRKGDYPHAAEWYERAMKLDPNIETAFRYYADMLAKTGDMAKSRTMIIRAAIAEPYNKIVWREMHAWAAINKTEIKLIYLGTMPSPEAAASDGKTPATPGSARSASQPSESAEKVWERYRKVRAAWESGGEFKKHFPAETEYRHTVAEETEALQAAYAVLTKQSERDKHFAATAAADPNLDLLSRLQKTGLIEPYILFSLGDASVAKDYPAYRAAHRDKLEEYLDKFVVPPAPQTSKPVR